MIDIGLDISLNSTAIYIRNGSDHIILSYMNEKKDSKYSDELSQTKDVHIHFTDDLIKTNNYSDDEISKLKRYDEISTLIVNDIKEIVKDNKCNIRIEGYSYTKRTSSIIDIVGFSTLIRVKLIRNLNCDITIISPASLKKKCSIMVYGYEDEKKKISRNREGIAGGSFKKQQIYQAILDGNIQTPILQFLKDNEKVIQYKKIPSPIDDINDSIILTFIDL